MVFVFFANPFVSVDAQSTSWLADTDPTGTLPIISYARVGVYLQRRVKVGKTDLTVFLPRARPNHWLQRDKINLTGFAEYHIET